MSGKANQLEATADSEARALPDLASEATWGSSTPSPVEHYEFLAYWEFLKGNLAGSIEYLEFLLAHMSKSYRETGATSGVLARYHAMAGDFSAADAALEGLGRGSSSKYHSVASGYHRTRQRAYCMNVSENVRRRGNVRRRLRAKCNIDTTEGRRPVAVHEEVGRGMIAQSKGWYPEAEQHYRQALALAGENRQRARLVMRRMAIVTLLAETLMRQGRLVEAETELRDALFWGKTPPGLTFPSNLTREIPPVWALEYALLVGTLAEVLYEQGRHEEAKTLSLRSLNLLTSECLPAEAPALALSRRLVAKVALTNGRWNEAFSEFEAIRKGLATHDRQLFETRFASDPDWGLTLLKVGQVPQAVKTLELAYTRNRERIGEEHEQTAKALGFLAMAHAAQGNRARALNEFRQAIPRLISAWRAGREQSPFLTTRTQHLRLILEAYVALLDEMRPGGDEVLSEMFEIADIARSGAVQQALTSNSARAAVDDESLKEVVRHQQDAQNQIGALQDVLITAVSLPSELQKPGVVASLRARIGALRKARTVLLDEIEQRYPKYSALVSPKSPSLEVVRAHLRPDEALVSILVSEARTYVWAVPKSGEVAYSVRALGRDEVERLVNHVRVALDPDAQTIGEIPRFELEVAHQLYAELLAPVRAGWRSAKTLLVAADGALGQLPLSLLPMALVSLNENPSTMFSEYKDVPWLAKEYAVVSLPSAASLVALRSTPQQTGARTAFTGFGDPWFSPQQAALAQTRATTQVDAVDTRGLLLQRRFAPRTREVDSAEIGKLPRLPETAEEVRDMALALGADSVQDVFVGKRASESVVKGMDLSAQRVLAFATHGLVPGDLNGLTQPALALSSPKVTGEKEDGLLTMGEILGLKLDADWVVLSACNTAAAQGAGAEAVSGLGRAFFYAGARSLLATHWSVETTSAKALTTEIFRRQSSDASMTRGEALRQAMVALIEGRGYVDPVTGQSVFSYAHPLFWAPFSLIGDGAR